MSTCLYCGKSLVNKRKHAKYCDSKCRAYASRQRKQEREKAKMLTMTLDGYAMLEQLRAILPKTADSAERFIEAYGVVCAEAAVKLCLTAEAETRAKAS